MHVAGIIVFVSFMHKVALTTEVGRTRCALTCKWRMSASTSRLLLVTTTGGDR